MMDSQQATAVALAKGVDVRQDNDPTRTRVADAIQHFLAKKSLLKSVKTTQAYGRRLALFADWCGRVNIKYLDQIKDGDGLLPFVQFLHVQKTPQGSLFEARYVFNIFQTVNTLLRANKLFIAGELLGELHNYEEEDPIPYKQLNLVGSVCYTAQTWERMMKIYEQRRIRLNDIVSSKLPISEWRTAFDVCTQKRGLKVLMYPE